jgi:hypothetical protein
MMDPDPGGDLNGDLDPKHWTNLCNIDFLSSRICKNKCTFFYEKQTKKSVIQLFYE